MDQAEFDKFATEYSETLNAGIKSSGESSEYFAEYKVCDVARHVGRRTQTPRRILDFGAGIGGSVPYFRRHLGEAALTCMDVSEKSLAIARSRFPREATFQVFDGVTIPFADDAFDIAFAACVFHHIDPTEHGRLFRELHRVIAPGGSLFVFEHNPLNPLTVHTVNSCPFDRNAVLIRAGTLRDNLRTAGFRVVQVRYRLFFPRGLRLFRASNRVGCGTCKRVTCFVYPS